MEIEDELTCKECGEESVTYIINLNRKTVLLPFRLICPIRRAVTFSVDPWTVKIGDVSPYEYNGKILKPDR